MVKPVGELNAVGRAAMLAIGGERTIEEGKRFGVCARLLHATGVLYEIVGFARGANCDIFRLRRRGAIRIQSSDI